MRSTDSVCDRLFTGVQVSDAFQSCIHFEIQFMLPLLSTTNISISHKTAFEEVKQESFTHN